MFNILFGWSKASKCKKLIKRVQCRLKLLMNKRICIMKQLKKDIAELLKHGHHHTAFERVEQVVIDENMVQVYDLVYQFCEFVIINLPYMSRHRDCPNDIKEAVSALIFSSSRFGELPELLSLRKLFASRYGHKFVSSSLQGNLVTAQITENLDMKRVPNDVKYRFLDEISQSFLEKEQLFLEYKHELQENEINANGWRGEKKKDEDKVTEVDDVFARKERESCFGIREIETRSESSAKLGEEQEVIYLDDIEEFISPAIRDGSLQDQRLFKFKSFGVPANETESGKKRWQLIKQSLNAAYDAYNGESDVEKDDAIGRLSLSLRANTMPCQRPKQTDAMESIKRSNSLPFSHLYQDYSPCRHIHPKLPDYDDLAAKFMDLKRAHLLNNSTLETD